MKTANLTDRHRGGSKNKRSPSRSLASTLGFGRRDKDKDKSPPPAVTQTKGTKTRRRLAFPSSSAASKRDTVLVRQGIRALSGQLLGYNIVAFSAQPKEIRHSNPLALHDNTVPNSASFVLAVLSVLHFRAPT